MNPKNKIHAVKVLAFYWQMARQYKSSIILGSISVMLAKLTGTILAPLILANVIDKLTTGSYSQTGIWNNFGTDVILYGLVIFSSGLIFWRLADYFFWNLEGRVTTDMARYVYRHLLDESASFHANNFSGSLVSNNGKLMSGYIRIADNTAYGLLPLVFTVLTTSIILFDRAPAFSLFLSIFSVVYVLAAYKISAPVRIQGSKLAQQESMQTGYLADSVTNVMAIKSYARNQYEYEQYSKITEKTRLELTQLMRRSQVQMMQFAGLSSFINVGSFLAAVVSVVMFDSTVATAFLIFNYSSSIIDQLFHFSTNGIKNYNRAIGDSHEMTEILSQKPSIQDVANPEKSHIVRGAVKFDRVTFSHEDDSSNLFEDLSLSIKPGEKIGLVGRSGSGKTTLTKLLLRFSDIQKGAIKIDGQDIRQITQSSLREAIAYVPQEPMLFHKSIAENIGYGREGATLREIKAIAKQANAHDFIEKLPKNYHTLVGERGVKLSGGQRQRVAIARAMLKNAPILLLDEATSALDSESEELIQDALWKLMEGRTAIVIAHRLSTIQKMDRILVMDNGKILEDGTHKELIRLDGAYAKLWQKQTGGFIEE